jgi:hypothetical protein
VSLRSQWSDRGDPGALSCLVLRISPSEGD